MHILNVYCTEQVLPENGATAGGADCYHEIRGAPLPCALMVCAMPVTPETVLDHTKAALKVVAVSLPAELSH